MFYSTPGICSGSLNSEDHFGAAIADIGALNNRCAVDLTVGAHLLNDDGGINKGAVWIMLLDDLDTRTECERNSLLCCSASATASNTINPCRIRIVRTVPQSIGTGRTEPSAEKFSGGEYRINLSATQNLVLSRDNALQFSFKREWHNDRNFNEVGVSYNFFF